MMGMLLILAIVCPAAVSAVACGSCCEEGNYLGDCGCCEEGSGYEGDYDWVCLEDEGYCYHTQCNGVHYEVCRAVDGTISTADCLRIGREESGYPECKWETYCSDEHGLVGTASDVTCDYDDDEDSSGLDLPAGVSAASRAGATFAAGALAATVLALLK